MRLGSQGLSYHIGVGGKGETDRDIPDTCESVSFGIVRIVTRQEEIFRLLVSLVILLQEPKVG